jgi:hypothetical protein
VISDYVDNYKEGLPSEVGLLLLMDPRNGVPKAIKGHPTDIPVSARSRGFLAHLILVADSMCRAASQAS